MASTFSPTAEEKKLIRRYLVWCYKTTKEELERVDRKFTQLVVDGRILKELEKNSERPFIEKEIAEFKLYMATKRSDAQKSKFSDTALSNLNPRYVYLKNRFLAVKKAIADFLGKKELADIERLYEEEFTRRILESREHT